MDKTYKGYGFVSHTDERMVIDFPLAGFKKDDIVVTKVNAEQYENIGRLIKVRASRPREKNDETGKLPIRVGYDHVCPDTIKEEIEVRDDFDIEATKVTFNNGLLRIEIPKCADALGSVVDIGN